MKGFNMIIDLDTGKPYEDVRKAWNKYVRYVKKYDRDEYFKIVDKLLKADESLNMKVNLKLELIENTLLVGRYIREA
jgi:hypothetical protein